MTGKLKLALLLIAIVVIGVFWFGGDKNTTSAAEKIETAKIDTGDIKRTVATSGSVRPLITVEVGSQVSGQIQDIYVDFNSPVVKGQLLAQIDPQSFESRVLQNRADLKVANSNVVVQQANIDRAEANLRRTQREYERAVPLARQGTLSASELDTALADYESARADVTMAKAQLENALATQEQRQASLESAEIDLERTKIRSPINGVVIERAVDPGQTVAASLSAPLLFNIAQDLSEIQIEANVDEADIGNVHEDNEVTFSVDAFPDLEFDGRVNQVRLAPNEANNVVTYTVIITAGNPDLKLLPGMTAIVEIVTGKSENVLRVPNDAIRFKPAAGSALAKKLQEAEAGAAATRSGPRNGPDIEQLKTTLGLSDAQAGDIEAEVKAIFAGMRAQYQGQAPAEGGVDRNALREQMRQQVSAVYEKHLTTEQFKQYQQIRRQAAETRSGQIWVQSANGDIELVRVRFGIGDDTHTQVISEDVRAGDLVVTRVRSVKE